MTLQDELKDTLDELKELGEVYLEFLVKGEDLTHVRKAIAEVTRKSRRLEEKIRKEERRG